MIVAGEASGDMHGAKLADALFAREEQLDLFGIGGAMMRSAGVRVAVDARRMAVVGITEVLSKLPQILEGMRTAKRLLVQKRPDLLILIDYPDFNLRLATFAKKLAIPILYYISPQIWAWRQGRVHKIRRMVDHMAVILPFEEKFYRQHGVPVTFVGHPLMDHYPCVPEAIASDVNQNPLTVGIMPGSRDSEIRKLLPPMLAASRLISQKKKVRFLLSRAPSVNSNLVEQLTREHGVGVTIFDGPTEVLLAKADLVILASGTSTLEAAIHQTPMIIVYKISAMSYRLGKALIRVPHIGLSNLIACKRVSPELIQNDASPENIAKQTLDLLESPERMAWTKAQLKEVAHRLGAAGASDKVARIALELIGGVNTNP